MITIVIISNDHHCNALSSSLPVIVITIIIISSNDWSWFKEHIEHCLKVHTSSSSLTSITQDVNFMLISLFVHAELVKFNFDYHLHGVMAAIPKCNYQKEDIQSPDNCTFPSITVTQMRHHVAVYYYWSMIMLFQRGRFSQMNAFNWGRW